MARPSALVRRTVRIRSNPRTTTAPQPSTIMKPVRPLEKEGPGFQRQRGCLGRAHQPGIACAARICVSQNPGLVRAGNKSRSRPSNIPGFPAAVPKVRIHVPPAKSHANHRFLSGRECFFASPGPRFSRSPPSLALGMFIGGVSEAAARAAMPRSSSRSWSRLPARALLRQFTAIDAICSAQHAMWVKIE